MNVRLIAARVIDDVTNGRSLSDCLESALKPVKDARDRAFIQAVCYGVCRFYSRLDIILSYLFKKPMKAKDSDVHALLLVGLYQLMEMRVPPHAAVAETVNAADKLKKSWARGLINAVLREYLRQADVISEKIKSDTESHYAHPSWWIDAIKKAWPNQWQDILTANNVHPPFSLRVNQRRIARDQYLEKLKTNGLSAHIIPETQSGITLDSPMLAEELPGFFAGEISVQDGAAQLAAELIELAPAQRVLDACAAPGGKLTHIVECEPNLSALIAIEKEPKRVAIIKDNLARLLSPSDLKKVQCASEDAANVEAWWDGELFDRILLDAPCSASGVIRRHPDIKLLRESEDIKALAEEQLYLLESLWPLLKTGGLFVYATCSIFPDENTNVLRQFLASHADAKEEKIHAAWGLACDIGRQILPGMHGMDGFYYAKIRKM